MRSQSIWLLGVLVVPGLMLLMLLMAWLEERMMRTMTADEILLALTGTGAPEDVEVIAAQRFARVLATRT